jgi:hypothetical protein
MDTGLLLVLLEEENEGKGICKYCYDQSFAVCKAGNAITYEGHSAMLTSRIELGFSE